MTIIEKLHDVHEKLYLVDCNKYIKYKQSVFLEYKKQPKSYLRCI